MATRRQGQKLSKTDQADLKKKFLEVFKEQANFSEACRQADDVARQTVYQWLDSDPDFKTAYSEAVEIANDIVRAEIWRRGVTGWDETETTVDSDGMKVKTVHKYDSGLLRFLAQARMPEFKERLDLTSGGEAIQPGYDFISGIVNNPDRAAAAARLLEAVTSVSLDASGSSLDS